MEKHLDNGLSNSAIAWIGSIAEPFDWVFESCLNRHLIRRWPDASSWFAERAEERARYSHLIFALSRRDRYLIEQINDLQRREPIVSVCVVMSDLWLGHRRSSSPKLTLPCFYWWNLQDQLLPWLTPKSQPAAVEVFQGKLSSGNDYWQQAHANQAPPDSNYHHIILTSNERLAEPLIAALHSETLHSDTLHSESHPWELMYFSSHLPEKQLEQWSSCSMFATQLQTLLQAGLRTSSKVRIWWCGGTMNDSSLTKINHIFLRPLEKKISSLRQSADVELGWYTLLADYAQWAMLRRLGFTRLVAAPFRCTSVV